MSILPSGIVQGNIWTFEVPSSNGLPSNFQEVVASDVSLNSAKINYSLVGDISSEHKIEMSGKENGVTNETQLFSVSEQDFMKLII